MTGLLQRQRFVMFQGRIGVPPCWRSSSLSWTACLSVAGGVAHSNTYCSSCYLFSPPASPESPGSSRWQGRWTWAAVSLCGSSCGHFSKQQNRKSNWKTNTEVSQSVAACLGTFWLQLAGCVTHSVSTAWEFCRVKNVAADRKLHNSLLSLFAAYWTACHLPLSRNRRTESPWWEEGWTSRDNFDQLSYCFQISLKNEKHWICCSSSLLFIYLMYRLSWYY